MSANQL